MKNVLWVHSTALRLATVSLIVATLYASLRFGPRLIGHHSSRAEGPACSGGKRVRKVERSLAALRQLTWSRAQARPRARPCPSNVGSLERKRKIANLVMTGGMFG
jgi:hypothetical protein